jgi:hypothetical protein
MYHFKPAAVAAVVLASALAAPAMAQNGRITFSGGSVAFIAGVHWGGGTLTFHHKTYPLKVSGLSVGAIGATSFKAEGEVYNLHKASDIEGTYGAVEAGATAGAGAGAVDMKNGKGVEIKARSSSAGLALSLAPSGVVIQLK